MKFTTFSNWKNNTSLSLIFDIRCGCHLRHLPVMQHVHWHALRSSKTPCPSAISHGTWKGLGGLWKSMQRSRKGPLKHLWRNWTHRAEGCYKGYSPKLQEEELALKVGTVTARVALVEIPATITTGSMRMQTLTTLSLKSLVYWISCMGLAKTCSSCGTWGSWSWTSVSSCVCLNKMQRRSAHKSILFSFLFR